MQDEMFSEDEEDEVEDESNLPVTACSPRAKRSHPIAQQMRDAFEQRKMAKASPNKALSSCDLRQSSWIAYCEWIAIGKSKESFAFFDGHYWVTYPLIEQIARDKPEEMPMDALKCAEAYSAEHWEGTGEEIMLGRVKNCQTSIWHAFMRNKFKWDQAYGRTDELQPDLVKFIGALKMIHPGTIEQGSD